MHSSKALTLNQTGGGGGTFGPGAYFDPKYLFFHKTYVAVTFSTFLTFTKNYFTFFFIITTIHHYH